MKGKKVSITATNGASLSGGAGAVDIDTKTSLSLNGSTVKVTATGPNVISGAPVKIN
jgi:hypothetical protein